MSVCAPGGNMDDEGGDDAGSVRSSGTTQTQEEEEKGHDSSQVVGQAMGGLPHLIVLQLASKLVTFVFNLLIARSVDPAVYGVANVQLQLMLVTVSLLARETFRRACLRTDLGQPGKTPLAAVVNVTWLVPLTSTVASLGVMALFRTPPQGIEQQEYAWTLVLFALAVAAEMLAEPLYIVAQNLFLYTPRLVIETAAVVVRCATTYLLVHHAHMGLLAYAYAMLAYGLTILVLYWAYFARHTSALPTLAAHGIRSVRHLLPAALASHGLHAPTLAYVMSYSTQAVEKLLLSSGEQFMLVAVATPAKQGVYALVANLGSLLARLLFQPVEETATALFSKLVGAQPDQAALAQVRTASRVLSILLKLMMLVGFVIAVLGFQYAGLLMHLLYGAKWSATEAPTVLAYYCIYVCTMALNGVSEAFVHAVGTETQMRRYNLLMLAFSLVYVTACWLLLDTYGNVGLVLANCINMASRIAYNVWFIRAFFARRSVSWRLADVVPDTVVLVALALLSVAAAYAEAWAHQVAVGMIIRLWVAAAVALLLLVTIWLRDRLFLGQLYSLVVKKKVE